MKTSKDFILKNEETNTNEEENSILERLDFDYSIVIDNKHSSADYLYKLNVGQVLIPKSSKIRLGNTSVFRSIFYRGCVLSYTIDDENSEICLWL
jgi:hypothetical protein